MSAALLALILLLVGALLIIGNTDSGRAFIVRLTAQLTKGHVQTRRHSWLVSCRSTWTDWSWRRSRRLAVRRAHLVAMVAQRAAAPPYQSRHLARARLHIERPPLPGKEHKPSSTPSIPHSDLVNLSVDTLEFGKELAGEPVSLVVKGSAHLRSLQDATAHVVAQRTGGNGNYELQLQFDPARMDATLKLQEPANGPLENLLKLPGLGELSLPAR